MKHKITSSRSLRHMVRSTSNEDLIKSSDEPDKKLDIIWAEEAERRLDAYRKGTLEVIPMESIFKEA